MRLLMIIAVLALFSSCVFVPRVFENTWYANPDIKNFTFREKVDYLSSDITLNIDGYYLNRIRDYDTTSFVVAFYRDGTFMSEHFSSIIPADSINTIVKSYKKDNLSWGRFYIIDDTIRAQSFWIEGGGLGGLLCYNYYFCEDVFKIVSTKSLIRVAHRDGNENFVMTNDTLFFVPCTNRCDSTFFFKEKRWLNKFNLFYTKKMREIKPL